MFFKPFPLNTSKFNLQHHVLKHTKWKRNIIQTVALFGSVLDVTWCPQDGEGRLWISLHLCPLELRDPGQATRASSVCKTWLLWERGCVATPRPLSPPCKDTCHRTRSPSVSCDLSLTSYTCKDPFANNSHSPRCPVDMVWREDAAEP